MDMSRYVCEPELHIQEIIYANRNCTVMSLELSMYELPVSGMICIYFLTVLPVAICYTLEKYSRYMISTEHVKA